MRTHSTSFPRPQSTGLTAFDLLITLAIMALLMLGVGFVGFRRFM